MTYKTDPNKSHLTSAQQKSKITANYRSMNNLMSHKTLDLTPALYDYLLKVSLREPAIMRQLRDETANLPGATMQISPEQGQFMAMLMQLTNAKKTLDIGTFTGYSALVVALALPADGKVIACDVCEKSTSVAVKYWEKANVRDKIDLRLAPALETLQTLIDQGQAGTFDFAFIDADKLNYSNYYEKALELLKTGGLIAVDNVLWDGHVIDLSVQDNSTNAIRALNDKIANDNRVSISMIPIGDGLTLARKK
jgi:predicted O-methyltransferase YrrM